MPCSRFGRLHENRVIGVGLDMLLQILGTLEGLSASRALVGFEWNMHSDMRSDMIPLHCGGPAAAPCAGQIQIVGTFPTDMAFTNMLLWCT